MEKSSTKTEILIMRMTKAEKNALIILKRKLNQKTISALIRKLIAEKIHENSEG